MLSWVVVFDFAEVVDVANFLPRQLKVDHVQPPAQRRRGQNSAK